MLVAFTSQRARQIHADLTAEGVAFRVYRDNWTEGETRFIFELI